MEIFRVATTDIELATREDAADILDLQRLAYRSEGELYRDWSIPPIVQTLADLTVEFDRWDFLCGRRAGVLVGSVRACQEAGTCMIGRLIVRPNVQGQGIGRSLMAAIEARFPTAERFELFTGHRSERNLALYQRLGYSEFRRQTVSDDLTLVFLEKPGTPNH
jgi:ribosomal protein S18 acetylase RimI-like enzyme